MDPAPGKKPGGCSTLAVLAMLGLLVALGLAANYRTTEEVVIAIAFLAAVLGLARLMQQTAEPTAKRHRDQPPAPQPSNRSTQTPSE